MSTLVIIYFTFFLSPFLRFITLRPYDAWALAYYLALRMHNDVRSRRGYKCSEAPSIPLRFVRFYHRSCSHN